MQENRNEIFDAFADTATAETVDCVDGENGESFSPIEDAVGAITEDDDGITVGKEDTQKEICRDAKTLREEYEELVKNRFKELYAEDMQRLINRRFRKYKIMEERYKLLEESLKEKEEKMSDAEKRIADFDERLRIEIERTATETEKATLERLRARKLRPSEVGIAPHKTQTSFDVSGLSRQDRAALARRAAGGEKIKF